MDVYAVLAPNLLPKKPKPTASKIMFSQKLMSLADRGINSAISTAKPVTPPKVKLLGNLKN